MGRWIAIDLGTSKCCVAIYQDNRVVYIQNDQNKSLIPTYVAFLENERLIGDEAKNKICIKPENTVFCFKRIIGRRYEEIGSITKYLPFNIIEDNNKPLIQVEYKGEMKNFTPEQITSMILVKLKEMVETFINDKVTDAVISVPANFNDSQREATMNAGKIAGFNNCRIINESSAAAYSYCHNNKPEDEKNILIFDLGGGKLDVSLFNVCGNIIKIRATAGNPYLGGEDFDNRLINFFDDMIKEKYHIDITLNKKALRRLRKACEKAKRDLSSSKQTTIEIDSLIDDIDFNYTITREKFEEINHDLFKKIIEPMKKVLSDTKLDKSKVDEIVLVGGSTRIPKIREIIKNFFNGKEPSQSINADEAIAYGAAIESYNIIKNNKKEENAKEKNIKKESEERGKEKEENKENEEKETEYNVIIEDNQSSYSSELSEHDNIENRKDSYIKESENSQEKDLKIKELTKINNDKNMEIQELKSKLQSTEEELDNVNKEKGELESKLKNTEEELYNANKEKGELESKLQNTERILGGVNKEKSKLESKLQNKEKELNNANKEKGELESKLQNTEKILSDVNNENSELKYKLQIIRKEFEKTKKEPENTENTENKLDNSKKIKKRKFNIKKWIKKINIFKNFKSQNYEL